MSRLLALSLTVIVLTGTACTESSPLVTDFAIGDTAGIVVSLSDGTILRSTDDGLTWVTVGNLNSINGSGLLGITLGANDSIWGMLELVPGPADGDLVAVTCAVSRDLGATFSILDTACFRLVHRPAADPLVLSFDELLQGPGDAADVDSRFVPLGPPYPRSVIPVGAVSCNGELFLSSSTYGLSDVWRLANSDTEWQIIYSESASSDSVFLPIMQLSCDTGDTLWGWKTDGQIFSFAFEEDRWTQAFDLTEMDLGGMNLSSARWADNGTELALAGYIPTAGHTTVVRIATDGSTEILPALPNSSLPPVHFAPDGSLWVASGGLYKWDEKTRSWDQRWP